MDTVTSAVWAPWNSERMKEASDQVTRSAGADSMPVWGNKRAPERAAVDWYFWSIRATKGTSPVTSR